MGEKVISGNKKKIFFVFILIIILLLLSVIYLYSREQTRYRVPVFSEIFFKFDEYKLKQNIRKHPYSAKAHAEIAYFYLKKGDTDQFEKEIRKAIDIDPVNISNLYSLGHHYESLGDYDRALEIYKTGVIADKDYKLPFYYDMGRVYKNLGENREALKYFEEALKHIDAYEFIKGKEFIKNDLIKEIGELKKGEYKKE